MMVGRVLIMVVVAMWRGYVVTVSMTVPRVPIIVVMELILVWVL